MLILHGGYKSCWVEESWELHGCGGSSECDGVAVPEFIFAILRSRHNGQVLAKAASQGNHDLLRLPGEDPAEPREHSRSFALSGEHRGISPKRTPPKHSLTRALQAKIPANHGRSKYSRQLHRTLAGNSQTQYFKAIAAGHGLAETEHTKPHGYDRKLRLFSPNHPELARKRQCSFTPHEFSPPRTQQTTAKLELPPNFCRKSPLPRHAESTGVACSLP